MNLTAGWRRLKSAGYRTALYRASLNGEVPTRLTVLPQSTWPGDPDKADEFFRGRYRFNGREERAPNQPPWRLRPEDTDWLRALHRFDWLRDFSAAGGETAQAHARRLVRSWIEMCDTIDRVTWAPEVIGRRLTNWLSHAAFLLRGADPVFAHAVNNSVMLQWRHLQRVAGDADDGPAAFDCALGLVYGALVLPGEDRSLAKLLARLGAELDGQVLTDGCYMTRSPSDQLSLLRDLIALADALSQGERPVPAWLGQLAGRLVPVLSAFRHGDGGLALFNGGYEEDADTIRQALARIENAAGPVRLGGGESGFHRLEAGDAVVLVDAGTPPLGPAGRLAHAGTASFELSIGPHRLVTNCGSGISRNADWRRAMRRSAAHSTLVIADTDSAYHDEVAGYLRRPTKPRNRRHEDEAGSLWLDLSHDGYVGEHGVMHHRRLFLDGDGGDFRGQDILRPPDLKGAPSASLMDGKPFVLRFHLHPDVQASPVQGGSAVLLRLGGRDGWRFRAAGGIVNVEESVYLGLRGHMRRTQQIVVSGKMRGGGATVKWAFRRA